MEEFTTKRRSFLKHAGSIGIGLSLKGIDLLADSSKSEELVILHTNDVHSHIHPFDISHPRYGGRGGVIRRAHVIDEYRKRHKNVLLLDAGDMFQGTPFFNFYGGELEIKLMSQMKYDAGTIGNHDFDGGVNGLLKAMEFGKFPLLNTNYVFENGLKNLVKPYKVFKKGKVKIGVFGVGIDPKGLVSSDLCKGTIYTDPVNSANITAELLKSKMKCDYVICLSHLGYSYKKEENKIDDLTLAKSSKNIDLIIGGHTHSFLDEPTLESNLLGKKVLVSQAAWAGLRMGVVKVIFSDNQTVSEGMTKDI